MTSILQRRRSRHRPAERRCTAPTRFFLFHRERRWNAGRASLDGMGAQARQADGVQPAAARRDRHELHDPARRSLDAAVGPVRHHARLRHAAADGDGPPAGRHAVASAEPAALRSPTSQRVTEGYGVLQPRVAVSVVSANRTRLLESLLGPRRHRSVHDGGVGRVSGSLPRGQLRRQGHLRRRRVRSGACRTRARERAAQPRSVRRIVRARRRSAPTSISSTTIRRTTSTFAARLHRWVRGDWQIARWLWRTVPDATGAAVPNTLPIIARWKILDNLRRSLMPPAIVALLVAGWTCLPGSPAFWTTMALLVLAFPAYIQVGRSIGSRAAGVPLREHLRAETDTIVTSVRQAAFSIIMLAHQSVVMLDAIGRVLVRVDDHAPRPAGVGHGRSRRDRRMRRSPPFCERCGRRRARRGHRRARDRPSRPARSCSRAPS